MKLRGCPLLHSDVKYTINSLYRFFGGCRFFQVSCTFVVSFAHGENFLEKAGRVDLLNGSRKKEKSTFMGHSILLRGGQQLYIVYDSFYSLYVLQCFPIWFWRLSDMCVSRVLPPALPPIVRFSCSGTTTTDLVQPQAASPSICSRLTAQKTAELSTLRSATRSLSVARTHVSLLLSASLFNRNIIPSVRCFLSNYKFVDNSSS